jgi:hypothetical protein
VADLAAGGSAAARAQGHPRQVRRALRPRPTTADGRRHTSRTGEQEDLWLVDADGTNPRRSPTTEPSRSPTAEPDGVDFVSGRSGVQKIWRVGLDGAGRGP